MGVTIAGEEPQAPEQVPGDQALLDPRAYSIPSDGLRMPADLVRAEAALGRNLSRSYERYQGMYPAGTPR